MTSTEVHVGVTGICPYCGRWSTDGEIHPCPPQPRTFGPCEKCGAGDIGSVQYHSEDCYRVHYACQGQQGEHLLVHCRRCGWEWVEKVGVTA